MRQRLVGYTLAAAAVGMLLAVSAASAQRVSPSIEVVAVFETTLKGSSTYSGVRGDAVVAESGSGERSINVAVGHAGKLSGRHLVVYAAGHLIGRMRVSSRGRAHLHRDTADGQYVPVFRVGGHLWVKIRTRRGVLVASGRLHFVPPPA